MAFSSRSNRIPGASSSNGQEPRHTLRVHVVVALTWPLYLPYQLEQTRGARIVGVYFTREEAMQRAHDVLQHQGYTSMAYSSTDMGQEGYRVHLPVIEDRTWVEEATLEMTFPLAEAVRDSEVIAELIRRMELQNPAR